MAMKVGRHLKRRGGRIIPSLGSTLWRLNQVEKEEKLAAQPLLNPKQGAAIQGSQGKTEPKPTRTHDIVCFKCQGRAILLVSVQIRE